MCDDGDVEDGGSGYSSDEMVIFGDVVRVQDDDPNTTLDGAQPQYTYTTKMR
jgi:hypothetical protein